MADEIKIESQDNTSELDVLKKRIDDIEMAMGAFNPRNLAGLRTKDLQQATRSNLFGNGSDGDVEITGTTTLTRDMFYNNLTIKSTGILNTKSFRVFCKNQFTKDPSGIVRNNGVVGGVGANGDSTNSNLNIGGTGGAAVASGSLSGGTAGGGGGKGADGGAAGTAGADAAKSLGSAGSGGGTGGTAGGGEGPHAGGAGGSQTGTLFNVPNSFLSGYYLIDSIPSVVTHTISAGSGGGGGGGCTVSSDYAGGGGGAGSTGGIIWIAANRIFIEGSNEVQCNGGVGGVGGDAVGAQGAGGGGGGAGGSGGVIILIYGDNTGTGTLQVAGGAAAAGGRGRAANNWYAPYNGNAGVAGQIGKTYLIQIQ